MSKKETWFVHPTKKIVLLFWFLTFLGAGFLIGGMTDFFTEPLQYKRFVLLWILIFLNISTVCRLTYNYYKNTLSQKEIL